MAEDKDRESTNGSRPDPDDPTTDELAAEGPVVEPTNDELAALEGRTEPTEGRDGPDGPDDPEPDGELVTAGAPNRATSREAGNGTAETKARSGGVARTKKDKATPKQQQVEKAPKRTTPAQFVREAVGELRKVVYPTGSQLANYFVVVLVFVLFIIGIVSLLDLGLGWAIFKIFA